jgi:hypothetical protein
VQTVQEIQSEVIASIEAALPLDVAFLDQATFKDEALRREVIDLYVAQLGLFRRGLLKPINNATWKYMTHTLKGVSAAVGADQMNALSRLWETQPTPETPDRREAILLVFDQAMEIFNDALGAIGR